MRLLIVADPVEALKAASDSSLALLRTALGRGLETSWCTSLDIAYSGDKVTARAKPVKGCRSGERPVLGEARREPLSAFAIVLVRKDPPFDSEYVRLCWLLALAEAEVAIFNRPSLLLRYHEKLVPLEALAQGFLKRDDIIPTFIGDPAGSMRYPKVVTKPFLGFAGGGVALVEGPKVQDHAEIAQPFEEEITRTGDRRVFLLGGKVLAHFVRMPSPGGFVSNLAQGGTAVSAPLSARDEAVLIRLGNFLKSTGIDLAGADVIAGKISEVNITSPTGIMSLWQLEQKDYSEPMIDYFVEKATRK